MTPEQKEIEICKNWILNNTIQQRYINYKFNSYGLKHLVSRKTGLYVCNDSFKEAAKILGLKAAKVSSQNECYNIKLLKTTNKYKHEGQN